MKERKTYVITLTLSVQNGITKATKEEVVAADYIPERGINKKYVKMSGSDKIEPVWKISWNRVTLTAEELFGKLTSGHAVTSLFKRKDPFNWVGTFNGQWERKTPYTPHTPIYPPTISHSCPDLPQLHAGIEVDRLECLSLLAKASYRARGLYRGFSTLAWQSIVSL